MLKKHKKFKSETKRVTVTLPYEMVEMYRQQAESAGCSVSWLLYTRLRSRGDIIIIGEDIMREVKYIRGLAEQLKTYIRSQDNDAVTKVISTLEQMLQFYPLYQMETSKDVRKYVIGEYTQADGYPAVAVVP